ncbi:MAG: LPS-assembly protein LptD, partial [Candidatus Cloacimonetes bacterium]|nr:LPS-assembly protein LptD [Candidatus Cloacimonadota bacterium]
DNKWQLKYLQGGNEKRLNELFSTSSSTSASLYKKKHPLSPISHRAYFRPGNLSLGSIALNNGNYKLGSLAMGYGAQFSVQQNPYLVHWDDFSLRSQYFAHSIALSGSAPYRIYFTEKKNRMFEGFAVTDTSATVSSFVADTAANNTWSLSLTHDLYAPKDIFRAESSNLRVGLSCKITDNWSLIYSNYYNLKTRDMISQGINLSRDLHCWKLDVSINRRNEYWDYRIVLFNTLLPDALKFQTRDSKKY